MDSTESSSAAPSLKRSLSKVKSVFSSTFKSNHSTSPQEDTSTDYFYDENMALKSMKYEETDTSSASSTIGTSTSVVSPANTRSNSNISIQSTYESQQQQQQLQLPTMTSLPSSENVFRSVSPLQYESDSIDSRITIVEGTTTDSPLPKNLSMETSVSNSDENRLLSPQSSIGNTSILLPIQKLEEEQIEYNKFEEEKDSIEKTLEIVNTDLGNLISPPISPSKPVFYEPALNSINEDQEIDLPTSAQKSNTEQTKVEQEIVRANDFADAMAQSILDKVDDENISTEWKI